MELTPSEKLMEDPKAMEDLVASKGWGILMEWMDQMRDGLKASALYDENSGTREESRVQLIALEKFCSLPSFLVKMRVKAVEDATSTNPS